MPETCPRPDTVGNARSLHDVAVLFNAASNTKRLQIVLVLASGDKRLKELAEVMGSEKRSLGQHLQALLQGSVVSATREGNEKTYQLTESGKRVLKIVEESLGGAAVPESTPAAAPPVPLAEGLERLHSLLRTFADPIRLRLLSLLAGTCEVCVCHLHEALELPQSTVSRHLAQLRAAGLISGRREGTWIYYRLAAPADDLHRVFSHYLVSGYAQSAEFLADKERLKKLGPCP